METKRAKTKSHPAPRRENEREGTAAPFCLAVLRAAGTAVLFGVLISAALCAGCMLTPDPGAYPGFAGPGVMLLSALVCGMTAAHLTGSGGLASGGAAGAIFSALLWGLSLCLPGTSGKELVSSLLLTFCCIALSALGGYIMTHRKPKKRKLHRS